jgi:hypothetical protein
MSMEREESNTLKIKLILLLPTEKKKLIIEEEPSEQLET